jgi:D-galactarolactone cycloisomerase
MLGSSGRVRVYASGINPDGCVATAEAAIRRGHRAFKLKIGFGAERDRGNLRELRRLIGDHVLAVDVNQGWSIGEAREQAPPLEQFGLAWLEEPGPAPGANGAACGTKSRFRSPAGKNIAGSEAFASALAEGVLSVIQPDVAKWGGITGCIAVAREVVAAKRTYCPHYLGAGIGLVASAHLLAACNGGWLEVDSNTNPLRNDFCGAVAVIRNGEIVLPELPGLGIAPDIAAIAVYRTL